MLPKTNRVDKKTIDRIFAEGRFLNSPTLTFKYIFTKTRLPRISFVAPKNIAKLAVKRNALRRRGYDAVKKEYSLIPLGVAGVFIFKKYEDDRGKIEKEIETILSKIVN